MDAQLGLFSPPAMAATSGVPEQDLAKFRYTLELANAWLTRAQLCQRLGWTERQVRDAAEALADDVVRCQLGFKLTHLITRDDLPAALQACDAFESQSKKMATYAHSLRLRLHALVG